MHGPITLYTRCTVLTQMYYATCIRKMFSAEVRNRLYDKL